jgi:glycosyltransferase involved in cell wall biosynthesis
MVDDKITIAFIIGSLGNARAGTERNLLNIIEHLDRTRFLPHLVSLQDCEYLRQGNPPCETSCLHVYRLYAPSAIRAGRDLAQRLRKLRIDIVQTFFTEAHVLGGRAADSAGVKAIISARRNLGYAYGIKERFWLKIANRYPMRWLANSRAVAERIAAVEGIARDKFDIIYNGVEIVDPEFDSRGKSDAGETDAVMVANLRPVKSVATFIEAAALVIKRRPRSQFAVLGDGPLRPQLTTLCRRLQVADNITLAGSRDDVRPWLANSRIGVLTSLSEGCSNAILEYMNASLPVVASAVGGNGELVHDGDTGLLYPAADARALADKLLYLLDHPQEATKMGQAGRRRVVAEFSRQRMIANYQGYYENLLTA